MVIYEVNASGPLELRQAYGELVRAHIEILMQQKGFLDAQWFERDPEDEEAPAGTFLWTLHYHVENRRSLDAYIQGIGQTLRKEAKERFAGKVQVNRRILSMMPAASLHQANPVGGSR